MSDRANGENAIVRLAEQQRDAQADEPTCTICGRFGEYICDLTDEDVCSLECRDITRERHRAENDKKETQSSPPESENRKRPPPPSASADDSAERVEWSRAAEARKRLHIRVENCGAPLSAPPPSLCSTFDALPDQLKANMAARGLAFPTPVQMQTIPVVRAGHHALVSAPTGTGKTAAFLVPIVWQIMERQHGKEQGALPLALVLAPIRELAIQIEDDAKTLMKGILNMKTALVVGGLPMPPQLHRLRQGVQLVVATPGRLLEVLAHHSGGGLLDAVRCCVVDEVDLMVSIGFLDTITQIFAHLETTLPEFQLVCTSATISERVEQVVASLLGVTTPSYVRIQVGAERVAGGGAAEQTTITTNANIDQSIQWVEENAKKGELFRMLETHQTQAMLVFVDSRPGADLLADAIQKKCTARSKTKAAASSFHAGKSQRERLQILEDFVNEDVRILVSTNVLGRGIDLLTVDHVVVFDAPKAIEEYVHLIGRAGRDAPFDDPDHSDQHRGKSTMFVNGKDAALFSALVQMFRRTHGRLPEQIYTTLRAQRVRTPQPVPVAVDDAKRAFSVMKELDGSDLFGRVNAWGVWKDMNKRFRVDEHS